MPLPLLALIFFLSALASSLILHFLIPYLRSWLLDQPNVRSSHLLPTPRGGGIAFVAVSFVSSGFSLLTGPLITVASLPLILAPLAVVGLLDDRHNLPASWRYGVQLLTASLILGFSPLVQQFVITGGSARTLLLFALVLLVITVTAVINFTNFMDGLDGLVAGCMAVSVAASSIAINAPWPLWALVGALLGFLLWNWSPAKVFMGDVGSTFLGAMFAVLVLQASTWPEALALLFVATPLLGDACLCVLRRLMARHQVFQAHRLHLFQRLYQAGWPHARVSSLYILATAILAIALLWGGLPWVITLAAVELLFGFWLDQHVAIPFAVASLH
jgi:Fuc2NAc and GlcNAc transferase